MKTYLTEWTENGMTMAGDVQADSWAEAERISGKPVIGELVETIPASDELCEAIMGRVLN